MRAPASRGQRSAVHDRTAFITAATVLSLGVAAAGVAHFSRSAPPVPPSAPLASPTRADGIPKSVSYEQPQGTIAEDRFLSPSPPKTAVDPSGSVRRAPPPPPSFAPDLDDPPPPDDPADFDLPSAPRSRQTPTDRRWGR